MKNLGKTCRGPFASPSSPPSWVRLTENEHKEDKICSGMNCDSEAVKTYSEMFEWPLLILILLNFQC